jgi:hypothetical protein
MELTKIVTIVLALKLVNAGEDKFFALISFGLSG